MSRPLPSPLPRSLSVDEVSCYLAGLSLSYRDTELEVIVPGMLDTFVVTQIVPREGHRVRLHVRPMVTTRRRGFPWAPAMPEAADATWRRDLDRILARGMLKLILAPFIGIALAYALAYATFFR